MARRKKQAIPLIVAPYTPPPQRDLADTALDDARTLLARHDVGVTDDTIDIWQTLRDLAGVVGDMSVMQATITELEADVKAADDSAKEAQQRERTVSDDADRRCKEAAQELRDALHEQSTELDTLRRLTANQDQQIRMGLRVNEELQATIDRLTAEPTPQASEPIIIVELPRLPLATEHVLAPREDSRPGSVRTRYAAYSSRMSQ